ncbi:hypothetical protein QC762_121000 [Podospora pseudocomata]|uniref:DUF6590 domain-containing protein n=1 Tax=Podospora pseudocomata TaxID=2093779 RepID=A0ABR0GY60_9PEZI|nr:hypothetical protein QC762_121000 [Podospora pseudocomata]
MTVAAMGQRPPHVPELGFFTLGEDLVNNPEAIVIPAVDIAKPVEIVARHTEISSNGARGRSGPTKTEVSAAQEVKSTNSQATKAETKPVKTTGSKSKDATEEDKKNAGATVDSQSQEDSVDYGDQWTWSERDQDYIRIDENGKTLHYTSFQKPPDPDATSPPSPTKPGSPAGSRQNSTGPEAATKHKWEQPLDLRFQVVTKPKRFFAVGRIFKVPWFEPLGSTDPSPNDPFPSATPPNLEYSTKCPDFHGEKPLAKYRWFVVVRRRLHHSLCFSITTYAGANKSATNKTCRGRDVDFVVLHNSNVVPAKPYEEENITRKPIGVIIEDQETYISPVARLDCGRMYTVEDHLRVMKVGRVHPGSLAALEEYFKDSVS